MLFTHNYILIPNFLKYHTQVHVSFTCLFILSNSSRYDESIKIDFGIFFKVDLVSFKHVIKFLEKCLCILCGRWKCMEMMIEGRKWKKKKIYERKQTEVECFIKLATLHMFTVDFIAYFHLKVFRENKIRWFKLTGVS